MAKASQRQVLATINPSSVSVNIAPKWNLFRFAQVSGGEITASVEKIYPGGATAPSVLCAPYEIGDITLTAHWDDDDTPADGETGIAWKLGQLRKHVGRVYYDITVSTYDCDLLIAKLDRTYKSCLLVGITEPDGDSSSGAPATFALTFSVQDIEGRTL